jgi:hypothetical protein
MICSDESSINNSPYNPDLKLFRLSNEKYNPKLVNPRVHVKPTISIMFWAGIWKQGRTPIILMKRDPMAPKNGYSSWSYIIAFRDGLLPQYNGTRIFEQDNSKIHISKEVKEWLLVHAIEQTNRLAGQFPGPKSN